MVGSAFTAESSDVLIEIVLSSKLVPVNNFQYFNTIKFIMRLSENTSSEEKAKNKKYNTHVCRKHFSKLNSYFPSVHRWQVNDYQ